MNPNRKYLTPCGYTVKLGEPDMECYGSLNVREALCQRCAIHRLIGEGKNAPDT